MADFNEKELWLQLLEKAWAKVNGSYSSTIAGLPTEAFSVLIEAPTFSYLNKKCSHEFWKIIDVDESKYIICTNSNGDVNEMAGLVIGHAYIIICAYELKGIRLLKLRNPWVSYECTEDYSDRSDKWILELRDYVEFKNIDDGLFRWQSKTFKSINFICLFVNTKIIIFLWIQKIPSR